MNRTEGETAMLFSPAIPTMTLLAQLIIEYSTLTKKKPLLLHVLVRAASLVFVYGGLFLLNHYGVRNYAVYYLLTAAYVLACVLLFKESLTQKLFLYFVDWGITSFVSSLCGWIAYWLAGGTNSESTIRYALYASSYLVIIPVYLKFWRARVKEMLALFQKGNQLYGFYPVLTFVVFNILFGPTTKTHTPYWFVIMVLFEGIILFSYYLLFSQIYAVFNRMQVESQLRNTERFVLLQKKYYEQVDSGIRGQREQLHDTRHHLVAMASLLGAMEYGALGLYIEQMLEKTSQPCPKRYCKNTVANAVIGGYIKLAEEAGIAVSVELDLPENLGIDDYELCTVFGNTLENAIEACQRIPPGSDSHAKRFIGIKSKVDSGRLIFRIENSIDGDIVMDQGLPQSSKGVLGGVGLASVRSVVERYAGCLSLEPANNTFVLSGVIYP